MVKRQTLESVCGPKAVFGTALLGGNRSKLFAMYEPQTDADVRKYYSLRWRILARPWQQPMLKDGLEGGSTHLLVRVDGGTARDARPRFTPIGVGRLHMNPGAEAEIRYVAVSRHWRGRGIGSAVMEELECIAAAKLATRIVLAAREASVGFFRSLGFSVDRDAPPAFGCIPCFTMKKEIISL